MAKECTESVSECASIIVSRIGQKMHSCHFLAKGSTCTAYKVRTNHTDLVLRIAEPNPGKAARFESDFAVRQALSAVSTSVAVPVLTNLDLDVEGIQSDWALDHFCNGDTLPRGQIPGAVSEQLGLVLSFLHRLPVSGYGKLNNSRLECRGSDADLTTGLLSRFEQPWPFSDIPLRQHPSVEAEPGLFTPLGRIESSLREFGTSGNASVVHGDLHELQFLVQDGQLSALLDFNESFAGRYEWDFGSYLYFHGSRSLDDLLRAYCRDTAELEEIRCNAWLASVLVALHHGNRAKILSRPKRLQSSVGYLKEALPAYL